MPHEEGGACMFWKSKAERFAERVRRRQEREAAELPVPEAPLALPGRLYPVDVAGGSFRVGGKPLVVAGVANSGLGTGMNVWDGVRQQRGGWCLGRQRAPLRASAGTES